MKSNINNLNSDFFRIIGSDLHVAVVSKHFSLNGLGPFINAFSRHFSLRTNRGNKAQVFLNFTKFYIAYYLMHSAAFTRYLYANNIFITCPSFTHVHLLKIICEVQARNKTVGFTRGQLEPQSSPSYIFEIIRNISHDSFIDCIKFSDFNNIVFSESDFHEFRTLLLKDLDSYVSVNGDFDANTFIIDSLSLPKNAVLKPHDFPLFRGVLDFGVSVQLGIHRFRNTNDPLVFATSQGSTSGLSNTSLELFANFLRLFEPKFSINNVYTTSLGTSDLQIDVSISPIEEVWFQYFNVSTVSEIPKNGKRYGASNQNDTTTTQGPNKNIDSLESGSVDYEGAPATSFCYGNGKYIPIKVYNPSRSYISYSISDGFEFYDDLFG